MKAVVGQDPTVLHRHAENLTSHTSKPGEPEIRYLSAAKLSGREACRIGDTHRSPLVQDRSSQLNGRSRTPRLQRSKERSSDQTRPEERSAFGDYLVRAMTIAATTIAPHVPAAFDIVVGTRPNLCAAQTTRASPNAG